MKYNTIMVETSKKEERCDVDGRSPRFYTIKTIFKH